MSAESSNAQTSLDTEETHTTSTAIESLETNKMTSDTKSVSMEHPNNDNKLELCLEIKSTCNNIKDPFDAEQTVITDDDKKKSVYVRVMQAHDNTQDTFTAEQINICNNISEESFSILETEVDNNENKVFVTPLINLTDEHNVVDTNVQYLQSCENIDNVENSFNNDEPSNIFNDNYQLLKTDKDNSNAVVTEKSEQVQDSVEIKNVIDVNINDKKNTVKSEHDLFNKEFTDDSENFLHRQKLVYDLEQKTSGPVISSLKNSNEILLTTNESNLIENDKTNQNKRVSDPTVTLASNKTFISEEKSKLPETEGTVNISYEEFLQIAKKLDDRDNFIYDCTFISDKIEKSSDIGQVNSNSDTKSESNNQQNSTGDEIFQIEEVSKVQCILSSENLPVDDTKSVLNCKQKLTDEKSLQTEEACKVINIIDNENKPTDRDIQTWLNIHKDSENDNLLQTEEGDEKIDTHIKNISIENEKEETVSIEQKSVICNDQILLSTEENICNKGTIDDVPFITTMINETKGVELSLPLLEFENVSTSSKEVTLSVINEANETCSETSQSKKSLENDQIFDSSKILQNKEVSSVDDVTELSENENIDIHTNDFEKILNENISKNVQKPKELINKLQSMEWLKAQSGNDSNMSKGSKYTLQKLPKKDEQTEDYFEGTKKNNNKRRAGNRHKNDRSNNSSTKRVELLSQENMEESKDLVQRNSTETNVVWNSNSANKLFPNVQSVQIDRMKEQDELEMAMIQSICTAQEENETRKIMEKNLKITIQDNHDHNEWGRIHHNLPDSVNSINLDDKNNNENPTKDFVDKYGRVDGYTEKHLFMGKGARKKEQEFLKAQTQGKPIQQSFCSSKEIKNDTYLSQNEQQSAYKNQSKEQSNLGKTEQQIVNKNHCKDQTETTEINQSQEKPIPIYGRSGRDANFDTADRSNKNVLKPGFRQEISKNVDQNQKDAPSKQKQDLVSKSQNTVSHKQECFKINQNQNIIKSHVNPSSNTNYSNVNQNHASKHQEYFNRNQYDRNQYRDNKSQSERFQDSNRGQIFNNRNHDSQTKDREHKRNQNYPDKMYENTRNPNYSTRNSETAYRNQYLDSRQRFNCEILNRNQERSCKNQPEENWDAEQYKEANINSQKSQRNQERSCKNQPEENWDAEQYKEANINSQKSHNNSNQHYSNSQQSCSQKGPKIQIQESKLVSGSNQQDFNSNIQDNRKTATGKETNFPIQTNITNEKQSTNPSLPKNKMIFKEPKRSTDSLISREDLEHPLHCPTPNLTMPISAKTAGLKEDNAVHDNSSSEPRPNVVMTFEGNQNVQRALGLNPNACNSLQINDQQIKNDVLVPNMTDSSAPLPSYFGSRMHQNIPLSQPLTCMNYNMDMNTPAVMNVNALPFESSNFNVNQESNHQFASDAESRSSNVSYGLFSPPNVDIPNQLRMNEISNYSQEMSRFLDKVSSLSRQLASAQAELLAAQAKFYQNASRSSNESQSQLLHPNLPTVNCGQALPIQNHSIPTEFLPMQYSTPPGYPPTMHNVQKPILNETYDLQKSYPNVNMQDFRCDKFLSNAALEQRVNLQSMYIQPGSPYQQQAVSFQQQYNSDANTASTVPRVKIMPQSNEARERRGCGSQFYNQ